MCRPCTIGYPDQPFWISLDFTSQCKSLLPIKTGWESGESVGRETSTTVEPYVVGKRSDGETIEIRGRTRDVASKRKQNVAGEKNRIVRVLGVG